MRITKKTPSWVRIVKTNSLVSHFPNGSYIIKDFLVSQEDPMHVRKALRVSFPYKITTILVLGLALLYPIVWCYAWHYVWLNVVVNKVILLLSKIIVIWIFGHCHIIHEMQSMWFMWFSHRKYKSQVLYKLKILVCSRWWNWAFQLQRL